MCVCWWEKDQTNFSLLDSVDCVKFKKKKKQSLIFVIVFLRQIFFTFKVLIIMAKYDS